MKVIIDKIEVIILIFNTMMFVLNGMSIFIAITLVFATCILFIIVEEVVDLIFYIKQMRKKK